LTAHSDHSIYSNSNSYLIAPSEKIRCPNNTTVSNAAGYSVNISEKYNTHIKTVIPEITDIDLTSLSDTLVTLLIRT